MCKKTRRLRGKLHEICKNDTGLMKEIARGIDMGFRECEYQFKNRRWNCTLIKPNMKKILTRGKCFSFVIIFCCSVFSFIILLF